MLMREVMTTNVVTVPSTTSLAEARRIMDFHKLRRLPVVDQTKLVGMVSRDGLDKAGPSKLTTFSIHELTHLLSKITVKEVMSTDLLTVSPDATVEEAVALGQDKQMGLRRHYLGCVLRRDVCQATGIPYNSLLRNLKNLIKPGRDERILDAGCGDGRLICELAGSGALIYGVDRSAQALRFAAAFSPGAMLSRQDLGALAFEDESFSTITMIETLEHINPSAVPGVMDEVRRLLTKGGRLVCTVPTHLHPRPSKHYRHFSVIELGSLLEEYFSVDSITGHDRDFLLYRCLVTFGDNPVWQLRAGFNRLDRARRLIAVCRKK